MYLKIKIPIFLFFQIFTSVDHLLLAYSTVFCLITGFRPLCLLIKGNTYVLLILLTRRSVNHYNNYSSKLNENARFLFNFVHKQCSLSFFFFPSNMNAFPVTAYIQIVLKRDIKNERDLTKCTKKSHRF